MNLANRLKPAAPYLFTVACAIIVSVFVTRHQTAAPSVPRTFSAGAPVQQLWFDVRTFGAVGNDVHDDTAAIVAADAAAQRSLGVVYFPSPPVAYKTTAEISILWPGTWRGDTSTINQTIIRLHSAARSVINLNSTHGTPQPESGGASRAFLSDLTIDANFDGIPLIETGAQMSRLNNVRLMNSNGACLRNALWQTPITLGAVVANVPGGSPAGVTMALADPNYLGIPVYQTAGAFHTQLKVIGGGALDTATFSTSFDNGATFQILTQPISATSNVAHDNGGGFADQVTGIVVTFPAGTYHSGDTYTVPVTITNGDYGQPTAANGVITYDDLVVQQCGTVAASAGVVARYNGFNISTVPGTVTVNSASPIVTGVGTNFTTVFGNGASRGLFRVGAGPANQNTYQVAAVFSDTVLSLNPTAAVLPPSTLVGQDYALGFWGGYVSDGQTEADDSYFINGHSNQSSISYSVGCNHGASFKHTEVTGSAMAGIMFGGGAADNTLHNVLDAVEVDSQAFLGYYFSPSSSGTWLEPHHANTTFTGFPGGWEIITNGSPSQVSGTFAAASYNPIGLFALIPTDQLISANNQTLTLPDFSVLSNTGNTSLIKVHSTVDRVLNGTPILPSETIPGIVIWLYNSGFTRLTFQTDRLVGTNLALNAEQVTIGPHEYIPFVSNGLGGACGGCWMQMANVASNWGAGTGMLGNTGQGRRTITTTASTTPTPIYCFPVQSTVPAPGTIVRFDVVAQAADFNDGGPATDPGTSIGGWLGCVAAWDVLGTRQNSTAPTCNNTVGSNAGAPPHGWTISVDAAPTAGFSCVNVIGDASANTITWTFVGDERDPGQ